MEGAIDTTRTEFDDIFDGICDRDFDALDTAVNGKIPEISLFSANFRY